jgi:SAM-dependent methyltransferase
VASESRKALKDALEGIEGYFWPREAWELHELVRGLAPERPATLVEIGSFQGRSTIAAALGLLSRPTGGRLYAIDHQGDDRFQRLQTNLARAGVDSVVTPIRSTSRAARAPFDGGPIDLIFIDGSHKYPDVRDDMADWLPLVRPGGVVALNDPFWPGVARTIGEHLAVGGPLRSPRFVENTLFFAHMPGKRWTNVDTRELRRLRASLPVGRLWMRLSWRIDAMPRVPGRVKFVLVNVVWHTFQTLLSHVLSPVPR